MDPFSIATTAGLGILGSVPKFFAGLSQADKARKLKITDSSTAAEREQLAMSRQAANSATLPGLGAARARLGMVQAGAVQNAKLGAGSSSDFLAAAGAADTRRAQGEQQLTTQGLAYQDAAKQQLRRDLTTQSQRQQRDLDAFNNQKAALTQSSAQNLSNGIDTAAAYGAQIVNMVREDKNKDKDPLGSLRGFGASTYKGPGLGVGTMGVPPVSSYNVGLPDEQDDYFPGIPSLGSGRHRSGRIRGLGVGGVRYPGIGL